MRAADPMMGIAREGWPFVLALSALALIFLKIGWWVAALACGVLAALAVAFFRESEVTPPAAPGHVLAPLSGRVVGVRRDVRNPMGDPATRVRLHVSYFGSYGLRAPTDAMVREPLRRGGTQPPPGTSRLQNARGEEFILVPRQGQLGRAPVVGVPFGQRIGQGRRVGARRAVRTLDIYLPPSVHISTGKGDVVQAGRSVVGSLS